MRRSTGQTWLVCAVMGIGIYALSILPTFHLSAAPSAFFPDMEDAITLTVAQSQDRPMLALSSRPAAPVIHYPAPASPAPKSPALPMTAMNGGGEALEIDPLPTTLNGRVHGDKAVNGAMKETQLAYAPPTKRPSKPLNQTVKVGKGDTLSSILIDAGVPTLDAQDAITAIQAVYNPRRLQAGQQITLTFGPKNNGKSNGAHDPAFQSLSLAASVDRKVGVSRNTNGGFSSHEVKRELKKKMMRAGGVIHTSLAQASNAQGLPKGVLAEMVRAFSYDVDFQRDIQNNDAFEVMFEGLYDNRDQFVRNGRVIFATLTLSGVRTPIYRYKNSNGIAEFYNEKGEGVQKALLRTPVNGIRLSSRYGKRRHPILGYTRMHKGVDFAANKGTPIRAAGNGVIAQAGRNGAYGHYIKIRHNSEYATAYAHLNGYRKGIHSGKRVKQGEIIGYVGSTGRSTGSHLHFEVIRHGRMINPLSVKLPSGIKLAGQELKKFLAMVDNIKRQYAQLPAITKLASRQ